MPKGFRAWRRDHCSTHSIDVVSKCSYGHSSCFGWSNVLQFLPLLAPPLSWLLSLWRQQHSSRRRQQQASSSSSQAAAKQAAAGRQQAGRQQAPEAIRFLAVVGEETTSKRRMKRPWNQTLATPGPEWAAPIPAAPAELSSRKINPWKN